MVRTLLITLATLVLSSTPALAAGFDVTSQPDVQRSLAVAETYWHTPASQCQALDVQVAPMTAALDAPGVMAPASDVDAEANIRGCQILLSPDLWTTYQIALPAWAGFADLCEVITHEYGHLIGLPDQPGAGVMDPSFGDDTAFAPCEPSDPTFDAPASPVHARARVGRLQHQPAHQAQGSDRAVHPFRRESGGAVDGLPHDRQRHT